MKTRRIEIQFRDITGDSTIIEIMISSNNILRAREIRDLLRTHGCTQIDETQVVGCFDEIEPLHPNSENNGG